MVFDTVILKVPEGFGCLFFEQVCHHIAQAGLEFMTLLPQLPKYWDYRYAVPQPATCNLITFFSHVCFSLYPKLLVSKRSNLICLPI